MDFLEFSDVSMESRGAMAPGRLKFTDTHIIFKNSKTGKVEQVSSSDIDVVNWQRFAGNWGIRIFTKNGTLHRFGGFKETEKEKLAKFFSSRYDNPMLEKEMCLKGWNWGTARFSGSVLSFDVANKLNFDVPLGYVSQCTTGKNEVTLEFHQNDVAPVSLMELRFHIPPSELAGDDPVEAFKDQVTQKASIISAVGDAIAIFKEIQCLTPRGRYDIKLFQSFFQLHGKTFDYKIPMSTVLRLFLFPHKDSRQMFFVVSLDPPIKQGQTRYHYLVFLFGQEEEVFMELPFKEEELQSKYNGKLQKEMSGPTWEVLSKIFKCLVNRKITTPGSFKGASGTPAISCSYKAAAGYVYPLERGFIFIHKPPLHIRFEEISSVNFARSGGSTRSFDFEVETRAGVQHTFSSIEKGEYPKLFDFITAKGIRVKNRGNMDKPSMADGFMDNSDDEAEPDAYLARVKAEAEERSEGESDEGSSEDEDYNPDKEVKKAASDDESDSGSSDSEGASEEESGDLDSADEEMSGKKKEKSKKKSSEPRKRRKEGGKKRGGKDPNAPKRPPTAYFLWFNTNREDIKKKNPEASMTELSKIAGGLWREMSDSEKAKWEKKTEPLKEEYKRAMKNYVPPERSSKSSPKKSKASSSTKTKSARKSSEHEAGSGKGYISKEFISESEDSDSDSDKDTKKKKGKGGDKKSKSKKSESEEELSGSGSGSGSD